MTLHKYPTALFTLSFFYQYVAHFYPTKSVFLYPVPPRLPRPQNRVFSYCTPRRKTHARAPDTSGMKNILASICDTFHIFLRPYLIFTHGLRKPTFRPRARQVKEMNVRSAPASPVLFAHRNQNFISIITFSFNRSRMTHAAHLATLYVRSRRPELRATVHTHDFSFLSHIHLPPFHAHQKTPAPATPTTTQQISSSQSAAIIYDLPCLWSEK